MINIKFPDGSVRTYEAGVTGYDVATILFVDLIKRLIVVFDQTFETYKLCKYVFDSIADNTLKNEANSILDQAQENGDFEPNNV